MISEPLPSKCLYSVLTLPATQLWAITCYNCFSISIFCCVCSCKHLSPSVVCSLLFEKFFVAHFGIFLVCSHHRMHPRRFHVRSSCFLHLLANLRDVIPIYVWLTWVLSSTAELNYTLAEWEVTSTLCILAERPEFQNRDTPDIFTSHEHLKR